MPAGSWAREPTSSRSREERDGDGQRQASDLGNDDRGFVASGGSSPSGGGGPAGRRYRAFSLETFTFVEATSPCLSLCRRSSRSVGALERRASSFDLDWLDENCPGRGGPTVRATSRSTPSNAAIAASCIGSLVGRKPLWPREAAGGAAFLATCVGRRSSVPSATEHHRFAECVDFGRSGTAAWR